jgi:hypothetical protein
MLKTSYFIILVCCLAPLIGCNSESYRRNTFITQNNEIVGKPLPLYRQETASEAYEINGTLKRFIYQRSDQPNCKYYIDISLDKWVLVDWNYLEQKTDCYIPKTKWGGPW